MGRKPDPIGIFTKIVDGRGVPTDFFIQQWNAQLDTNTDTDQDIVAGAGLEGGGALADGPVTISMPDVGTAGTFGSATEIPVVTLDAQGRVELVTLATVAAGAPSVEDEGVVIEAATGVFNFTGAGVTVTSPAPGQVDIAINGTAVPNNDIIAGTGLTGGGSIIDGDVTLNLSNVGTAGTYGSASLVPTITTDAQGRVTSVTTNAPAVTVEDSGVSVVPAAHTLNFTGEATVSASFAGEAIINVPATDLTDYARLDGATFTGDVDIANTSSIVLEDSGSGRGEITLGTGNDTVIQTSSTGVSYNESLRLDNGDGSVKFPSGRVCSITGRRIPSLITAGVTDLWRADQSRVGFPRSYTISGVSGTTITLTTTSARTYFGTTMTGNVYLRVFNTSKSPAQSAWLSDSPTTSTLTVTDASDIVGWSFGDQLTVGDPNPTGTNTLRMAALDISPFLMAEFGVVFPQVALSVANRAQGVGGVVGLLTSATGGSGSVTTTTSLSNGDAGFLTPIVTCSELSPISNSNLVFVKENLPGSSSATAMGINLMRVNGVYVEE